MSLSECDIVLAGRYRLQGRIASGGMGEVWRAVDTVLERPVAVKLLRAGYADDPDTLARFRAEARHAAAVSHPGIAHVYDYGEGGPDGSPFLVMELVDGPALTELLARGPLDPAQSMDVVAQAATALAAAHAAGLVHRDIKPGNLLVGPGGIVKITDFGIAYAAGSAPLTRTGALIGTPAYLAPERVAGAPATPSSDLYSLGIVAYECLASAPPFTGTPMQIALAHQRQAVPPLPVSVPRPVAGFVADLTAREPWARPRSATDVAARARYLQAALAGEAKPGGWPASLIRPLAALASRPRALPPVMPVARVMPPVAEALPPAGEPTELTKPTLLDAPETVPDAGQAGPWPRAGSLGPPPPADSGRRGGVRSQIVLRPPLVLRPPAAFRRPAVFRRSAVLRCLAVLRRPAVLAVAVVAVLAGVGGWLLAGGARSPAPQPRPPASSSAHGTPAPASDVSGTVEVNRSTLVGQSVQAAERQLRQLGLRVTVTRVPSRLAAPGTVLGVGPSGRVPAGTPVVLTVASRPRDHHRASGSDGTA